MGIEHKLTAKSQVTIPKDVRVMLGVQPGDLVRFERAADGRITLSKGQSQSETLEERKVRIRAALDAMSGVIDLGGLTTDEYMRELRGDWEP